MKGYYKILGVKEDASSEEIRGRYVKLAKLYHPDLRESVQGSDRIKEINEAYEVLKDDSTRMDYDLRMSLERAYLKKRGKEKERSWLTKKAVFPISILFLFFLFSLFLWKKPAVHVRSSSVTYHPIAKRVGENPAPLIPTRKPEPEVQVREVISKTSPPVHQEKPRDIQINSMKTMATVAVPEEVMTSEPPREIEQKFQSAPVEAKPDSIIVSKLEQEVSQKPLAPTPPPLTSKPEPPINITSPIPRLLLEEEVKQFLANYIDRYVQKDIYGFLSLFSSKAIQNGKDGLKKIRDIYVRFFDQSEELTSQLRKIYIKREVGVLGGFAGKSPHNAAGIFPNLYSGTFKRLATPFSSKIQRPPQVTSYVTHKR